MAVTSVHMGSIVEGSRYEEPGKTVMEANKHHYVGDIRGEIDDVDRTSVHFEAAVGTQISIKQKDPKIARRNSMEPMSLRLTSNADGTRYEEPGKSMRGSASHEVEKMEYPISESVSVRIDAISSVKLSSRRRPLPTIPSEQGNASGESQSGRRAKPAKSREETSDAKLTSDEHEHQGDGKSISGWFLM